MIAPYASRAGPVAHRSLCDHGRSRPAGGAGLSQNTPREPDHGGAYLPGDGATGGF